MQIQELAQWARLGVLARVVIRQNAAGRYYITATASTAGGEVAEQLHTFRGGVREFGSLDAAARTAFEAGASSVVVERPGAGEAEAGRTQ